MFASRSGSLASTVPCKLETISAKETRSKRLDDSFNLEINALASASVSMSSITSSKDCLASLSRAETVILSAAESCIESPKHRD